MPAPVPPPVLAGEVVVIDPGHNGDNDAAPTVINQPVRIGRGEEPVTRPAPRRRRGTPRPVDPAWQRRAAAALAAGLAFLTSSGAPG